MREEILQLVNSSAPEEISQMLKIRVLEEKNQELESLLKAYSERLNRQGDWKDHYQELSQQHGKLREEFARLQNRVSPMTLSLRRHWLRPTFSRRTLEDGFDERQFEEYIWYQLELIEPGLRFCGHQVACGASIIDIVAEDRYSKHTLIELKVEEDDPRLMDQVIRYPKVYSQQFSVSSDDIRMIVIAPGFGAEIKRDLFSLGVRLYQYEMVDNGLGFSSV